MVSFIDSQREHHGVEPICRQLPISPSTYYEAKARQAWYTVPVAVLTGIPQYSNATGEMQAALGALIGPEAKGLSAVSRLKRRWASEYDTWRQRRWDKDRWVYLWADGIYSGLPAEQQRLCALVVMGVNERGEKHFLAIEEGVRESTQSWRELLLGLKHRGLKVPQLAVGDGALGFWAALDEVFPETRQQRCWMHKTGNVLNALPKTVQAKAKRSLQDIWQAPTREDAEAGAVPSSKPTSRNTRRRWRRWSRIAIS